MKTVNFWKTLLFSVMALGAFTGCNNDDDPGEEGGLPSITVNGEKSTSVAIDYEGGTTSEIEVVSTGSWTLTFSDASASWCTPSAVSGSKGTTKLTFSAEATTTDREITATLATSGSIEGIPMEAKATIVIKQNAGGVAPSDALYIENCGENVEKDGNYWPYTDQFTGWSRKGTLDQSGVTYDGSGASVRNSGVNYAPSDEERGVVSDAPYVYMTKTSDAFNINGINVGSNTSFTFTFTAQVQASYGSGPVFATVDPSMVKLSVAAGDAEYAPVNYTVKQVATGSWYLCTAEFKLPASVSTDKISVRFDSFAYASGKAEQLRLDDFTLYAGGNGEELQPETAKLVTIDQITEAGLFEVKGATVVATYKAGFVIQDATGALLVYKSEDVAVGDVVTVSGTVSMYGGAYQFTNDATVSKTGTTTYTPGTPAEVTADNIAGMMTAPKAQYVKMAGKLEASNYYNVIFDFTSDYTGSITSPNDDLNVASFDGKEVEVLGWFVNNGSKNNKGTFFTVVATAISEKAGSVSGSFTDAPKTFAATDPEPQTLAYTASEAAGEVSFKLAGTNADKFSVEPKTGEVVVSAVGDNTSDAAYKATLQMKAQDGTVLDEVELVQAAPAGQGGAGKWVKVTTEPSDWSGDYLIVYEEGSLIFDGSLEKLDVEGNIKSVTISGDTIESSAEVDACKFTVEPATDGYAIKSASGFYIYQNGNSNGLSSKNEPDGVNQLALNSDASVQVTGAAGAVLRYNNAATNGTRFRYYKSSSYMNQQPVAFYKYIAE